ncbi:MAG: SpoIIE family protein phosphatase [Ruminococcus sp.]|nr:SpoIIE family protein phosphatase [Ruminococcus sp.]
MEKSKRKISKLISLKLLIPVIVAFMLSFVLTFLILFQSASKNAYDLVKQNAIDVAVDINEKTREYFYQVSSMLTGISGLTVEEFRQNLVENEIGTTYVSDYDGNIIAAATDELMTHNIREIPEISGLLDELNSAMIHEENVSMVNMTENPQLSLDGKSTLYYAMMTIKGFDGLIVFGIEPDEFDQIMIGQGQFVASNRHIGKEGFNVLVSSDKKVLTTPSPDAEFYSEMIHSELIDEVTNVNSNLAVTENISRVQNFNTAEYEITFLTGKDEFWGKEYFYCLMPVKDVFYIYSLYPVKEALGTVDTTMRFLLAGEIVIFTVLFFTVRFLIKRTVVKKLDAVNASLTEIASGNLEEKVEVRDTQEFDALSTDINATVDKLKEYIAEAAARIDSDLAFAKAIQSSALPSVFPPFPERKEFELYATMNTAKEVGGDFYDFFMLGDSTLGFLIADVSGKSIPGAMFMMTAKTLIKSLAESGLSPAEVFTQANEKLCEGNDAEMFVTAWLGFLDLKTGIVRVSNAGHNPPVLIHEGEAKYVILRPGLMLAAMDDILYKEQTLTLQKGDMLYLYTDGVTEAMDTAEALFGEERLLKLLSFGKNYPAPAGDNGIAGAVCAEVTETLNEFTEGAEQSDDITMLCIRYLGGE